MKFGEWGWHDSTYNSALGAKDSRATRWKDPGSSHHPLGERSLEHLSTKSMSIRLCVTTNEISILLTRLYLRIVYSSEFTMNNTPEKENATIPYWVYLLKSGINILASGDEKTAQVTESDCRVVSFQIDLVKLTMYIGFFWWNWPCTLASKRISPSVNAKSYE